MELNDTNKLIRWHHAVIEIELSEEFHLLTPPESSGTGTLLKVGNNFYLITAAHVICRTQKGGFCIYSQMRLSQNIFYSWPGNKNQLLTGLDHNNTFIKCDGELDIAVIALNRLQNFDQFINQLRGMNYLGLSLEDIYDKNHHSGPSKNDLIITIGFPFVNLKENFKPDQVPNEVLSYTKPIPIMTAGCIQKFDTDDVFLNNISCELGNSGGPIIFDDKLIGIVAGKTLSFMNVDNTVNGFWLYKGIVASHSSHVLELINQFERV